MFKLVRYALLICSLAISGIAFGTTYYVAANGIDTNSGTSKTSPWLHAPGMTGCAGVCASTTPHPGDSIILRGGDSWHWNSAYGTVGLPWTWTWSGSGSTTPYGCNGSGCIHIGVDQTWYSGSSWSRPQLNGDNPLSTSTVSSCRYSINATNDYLIWDKGSSYTQWDNLEMLGVCEDKTSGTPDQYFGLYGCYHTFSNIYMHGWTMASAFGDKLAGFAGPSSGSCPDGKNYPFTGNQFTYNIFDGSDSSPQALESYYLDCYVVDHSYMTMNAGNNCNNMHLVHDTVIEYNNEDNSNGVDHGDTWQFFGEAQSNNYFYNNVVRHSGNLAGIGINVIFEPSSGYTDTAFNNLFYDVKSGNFLSVNGQNGGNIQFINNTYQISSGTAVNCVNNGCLLSENNHYITAAGTAGSQYNGAQTPRTQTGDLVESLSAANTAGYTSSNQYAPSSSTSPTVHTGTNWISACSSLTDSNAAAACASGTNLACSYTLGSGVLNCPGQPATSRTSTPDIGAYVYGNSGLQPPTNLSASVK